MRKIRALKVPVTQGLVDELGQVMHFALMGMEAGDVSATNWKSLGKVLLTMSIASDGNYRVSYRDKELIDRSVTIMGGIADRELDTGSWQADQSEVEALAEGVIAAERALPLLDYRKIGAALHDVSLLMGVI